MENQIAGYDPMFASSFRWRRGRRPWSQPKRFRIWQNRILIVKPHGFSKRFTLIEPGGGGLIITSEHTVEPIRSILGEPLLPIGFLQYRKLFRHLAQRVVDVSPVAT